MNEPNDGSDIVAGSMPTDAFNDIPFPEGKPMLQTGTTIIPQPEPTPSIDIDALARELEGMGHFVIAQSLHLAIAPLEKEIAELKEQLEIEKRFFEVSNKTLAVTEKGLQELRAENARLKAELEASKNRELWRLFDVKRFEKAPCFICGYNGEGYYQPDKHPCAVHYHDAIERTA